MKIIADKNMLLLNETFGQHGDVQLVDGRQISRADLRGADVLLVRSVTRVDRHLLQGTRIQFVGSATIGVDHLDTAWLEANNIAWANAPGCNANSAAQWALAMMWLACERSNIDFKQQRVGIIGRGNVGRRLEHLLKILEIPVMTCDPPLQASGVKGLVSMQDISTNSIVSLHVPLTRDGNHPTEALLESRFLHSLKPETVVVNTSRGPVIDGPSLLEQLQSGRLRAALDVWPDEPYISRDWLQATCVATPHVAGYSTEGKQAGTAMIYAAFCRRFAIPACDPSKSKLEDVTLHFPAHATADQVLRQAIQSSCPVARDDSALRTAAPSSSMADCVKIDSLRANYPVRREFKSHRIMARPETETSRLRQLGFKTE